MTRRLISAAPTKLNRICRGAVALLAFALLTLGPLRLHSQEPPVGQGEPAVAGGEPAVEVETSESKPRLAADTSSPRDTLRSFIDACNEFHEIVSRQKYFDRNDLDQASIIERALDCIDDSHLPAFAREERTGEVTACLKEILDRVEIPPWDQIPDRAEIDSAGGLEKLTDYRIPDTRITISRVEDGPRRHEYLFSPGTVERAVRYYRSIEARPYRTSGPNVSEQLYRWYLTSPGHPVIATVVDQLPERMRLGRTLGMANWKWPLLIALILVSALAFYGLYRLHVYTANRFSDQLWKYWLTLLFPLAAIAVPYFVKHVSYRYLTLRSWPLYITDIACLTIAMLSGLVVIFAANNRIASTVISSPNINPNGLNAQLIRIVAKLASLAAAVALFLVGGQYLGIPIATLLASAGIGGVAVALGAQDSLKTLFGTINLLSDKPFRVGDRIIFLSYDGVVEDIGLRSTSLRLLNGHQVTLPNDQLAGNDIENVGRRQYIRRAGEIHIPLDSNCDRVEKAVAIIREELKDHEGMDPEFPPRVFFDEFGPSAFRIKFLYWYSPPDYWKFKAFGEAFNFRIFRRFEAENIPFNMPSRLAVWSQDGDQPGQP